MSTPELTLSVITSYSIHYTKLYDRRPVEGTDAPPGADQHQAAADMGQDGPVHFFQVRIVDGGPLQLSLAAPPALGQGPAQSAGQEEGNGVDENYGQEGPILV